MAKISAQKCTSRPIYVAGSMSNQQPKQPAGAVISEDGNAFVLTEYYPSIYLFPHWLLISVQGPSLTALAKWPPPDEEYTNYLYQARILVEEGVDFIFLEMLKVTN